MILLNIYQIEKIIKPLTKSYICVIFKQQPVSQQQTRHVAVYPSVWFSNLFCLKTARVKKGLTDFVSWDSTLALPTSIPRRENMNQEQPVELTAEQISVLLQIINKGTYVGEQVEIVAVLKQTLVKMLQQKQQKPNK